MLRQSALQLMMIESCRVVTCHSRAACGSYCLQGLHEDGLLVQQRLALVWRQIDVITARITAPGEAVSLNEPVRLLGHGQAGE